LPRALRQRASMRRWSRYWPRCAGENLMDGVVVIDKPSGMTSHDVVDAVRKKLKMRKVGHGGTLDPDATGVLLVGVGRATRFLSYAQRGMKRYTAVARFGVVTSTQDASGTVISKQWVEVNPEQITAAARSFVGRIEQVPPMVSAVKIKGERLYRKALRGETVERPPRRIEVAMFELIDFAEPTATFDVKCSGGTYIRTLVHDLGEKLGCGAHLASLRRTEAGGFTLDEAVVLDEVTPDSLRPLVDVVKTLPSMAVDAHGARLVSHGAPLDAGAFVGEGECAAVVHDGRLLAVYKNLRGKMIPDRVISQ